MKRFVVRYHHGVAFIIIWHEARISSCSSKGEEAKEKEEAYAGAGDLCGC